MTKHPVHRPEPKRCHRGFSLLEILVALALLTIVLVGALILLDTTNQVTRAQIARADIQQSVRIAQAELASKVRTAGRGGLLAENASLAMPTGVALKVENNVPANRTLFASDGSSPKVLQNSDILTVRGAFDNPLYYVKPLDSDNYTFDTALGTGEVIIPRLTPDGQFVQELELLDEMKTDDRAGEAAVFVSPFRDDVYGVVAIDWSGSSYDPADDTFTLAFKFQDDPLAINPVDPGNDTDAASVLSSGGAFPKELFLSGFKSISVLQEYRFFIRDTTISGTDTGRFAPKLSMVRTQVNQDKYWLEDPADPDPEPWADIADYIIDLQVAFGYTDGTGAVTESADGDLDQWFGNHAADVVPGGNLSLLRVTTLARAATPDRNSEARPLLRLEDRTYTVADLNEETERKFRRFFMPTIISLRNL